VEEVDATDEVELVDAGTADELDEETEAVLDVVWTTAVAAQAQTADAEDCTANPVVAPHALITQRRAADEIAAAWELLH